MEHILQYILPSILGDFIQGIDKNHMKTNLLSGKVSLQGVSLNPAILKTLNLPSKIIYSNIGKFEIKIPWLQRLKQPMEIYLEDLFVILEPTSSVDDFDIVEERIKFLNALTKECRNKLKNLNQDPNKEGSSMDYYKILILDNLQVYFRISELLFMLNRLRLKIFISGLKTRKRGMPLVSHLMKLIFVLSMKKAKLSFWTEP